MKKIYFAGKFNLLKDNNLPLEQRLINDYRSKILGSSKLLTYHQEKLIINDNYQYLGPFYCEQASNGNYTSTDCNVVLNSEMEAVKNCDIYVAVFNQSFSVGTIVELGWAISMNKKIIIFYQNEETSYQIKSEYWFAIADAIARGNDVTVFSCNDNDEVVEKIKSEILKIEGVNYAI